MNTFVLDASVALKWTSQSIPEPLTDQALRLLRRYIGGEVEFIVPDVFWAEVGNVLWKGVGRRRWTREGAEMAASEMRARDFLTVSSFTLLPGALRIGFVYGRGLYDSLYAALAVESQAELITADERLANALAAHIPVKWLGAF